MDRQAIIETYRKQPVLSVLIVGAGINGIGTFRDLSLQRVDVLLVDKNDFCSGASAASSRLAHGGIRYLEHGDFRLVRESLTERNRLLQNAPHVVIPQRITIPIFSWFSGILNAPLKFLGLLKRPSERGAIVIKIGMALYDWFTRYHRMTPTHRMLSRQQALERYPALSPAIIAAGAYYDSLMPYAERIGVELVLDGEAQYPDAHALNYVSIVSGSGETVQLRDKLSGQTFEVRPKIVINATGAWIDFVNRAMKHPTSYIGGTKGSHIIVDHPDLAKMLNGDAIYFENTDGRLCIFLPIGDKIMVGATDIRISDPDQAVCTDEEIDYILGLSKRVLPGVTVDRSQIVFHFSGVRPLAHVDVKYEGLISRDHIIQVIEPDQAINFPVYSLVGGKWTTYRALSEQTTDKILGFLHRERKASTANLPIGGGLNYPRVGDQRDRWISGIQASTGVSIERLLSLFERYGTRAELVAVYISQGPDEALRHAPAYSLREIMFVVEHEKVNHLDDLILRRSILGMLGLVDRDVLQQAGEAAGRVLNWSEDMLREEIERTADILRRRHGIPAARLEEGVRT